MLNSIIPGLNFLRYNGGKIAYRDAGEGPTILLFHGMNGSSKSWATLFNSLGNKFRLVAWDAPSFGESDVFGDSIEDYTNAAKALISSLEVEDIIVIGHSMGGLIATRLAGDKDVSLAGLVLSSCHLGFGRPKGEALMSRYADRIDALTKREVDMSYALERAKRSTPEGTPKHVREYLVEVAKGARMESIRDGGRMSQETDNSHICKNIKVPVVILSGGKDKIISPDMHDALITALPEAEQVVFPEAGHASYVEYPKLFQKQVEVLAKKVWKPKQSNSKNNNNSNIFREE